MAKALDTLTYREVWPRLEANLAKNLVGELTRTTSLRWHYRIVDTDSGQLEDEVLLPRVPGAILAAILTRPGSSAADLLEALDQGSMRYHWQPKMHRTPKEKEQERYDRRINAVHVALRDLRKRLSTLAAGLERFSVRHGANAVQGPVDLVIPEYPTLRTGSR